MKRRTLRASLGLAASAVLLVSGLGLGACAGDEHLAPLPRTDGSGGAGGQGAGGQGGATPAAPKRRLVTRDPYGDVAAANNLLFDGDFEWFTSFADQYGWLALSGNSVTGLPDMRLGAECTSGLRCASVKPNRGLIGLAVASAGHGLAVSVKVKAGDCSQVGVYLESQGADPSEVVPPPDAPGADGWCAFGALVPEKHAALYLYVDNGGTETILVDDAVVAPVPPGADVHARPSTPPGAELAAHLAVVRAAVRRALVPRDPPPNEARRRFEAAMQQKQRPR